MPTKQLVDDCSIQTLVECSTTRESAIAEKHMQIWKAIEKNVISKRHGKKLNAFCVETGGDGGKITLVHDLIKRLLKAFANHNFIESGLVSWLWFVLLSVKSHMQTHITQTLFSHTVTQSERIFSLDKSICRCRQHETVFLCVHFIANAACLSTWIYIATTRKDRICLSCCLFSNLPSLHVLILSLFSVSFEFERCNTNFNFNWRSAAFQCNKGWNDYSD